MGKPFYKCIMLVLASNNTPLYRYFKRAYESYMHSNPDVKVFFVYGNGVPFERHDYDLVYNEVGESYNTPDMALKTVKAFDYIDQNYRYNYMVRTNLSTFWVLDKLLEKIESLPRELCVAGRMSVFPPPYATGSSMFISSDLIPMIVCNVSTAVFRTPKYTPEDKMICEYFTNKCGAKLLEYKVLKILENLQSADPVGIQEAIESARVSNLAGFRIKNLKNRDLIDTAVISTLCMKFYGVDIGVYDGHV